MALNMMSLVDISQDILGILFGVSLGNTFILLLSFFMLFLDVYAIYLVALDDPFFMVSFPTSYEVVSVIESASFSFIMYMDFLYDGAILGFFLLFSLIFNTNINGAWWILFGFTIFTLALDVYQYTVFNKYDDGEEDLFKKYEEIENESE